MTRLLRVPNLLSSSPAHLAGGLFAFAAVFCVVWMVSFMCASHHHHHQPKTTTKSRRVDKVRSMLGAGEGRLREWGSDHSSKALLKMVSWMRLQQEKYGGQEEDGEGDDGDDDEEAIWRKTIIMGQRCRPLEFSEKVVSDDSKSNLLPG